MSGRESPQKRAIWRRAGNARFAETGWWCAQSYANRSPCYLANIRVIFENNREPAAKSVKKTCGTGISLILRQFDIREEQGAPNCRNTERAFDELGGGKRTHSDQESGPTSYQRRFHTGNRAIRCFPLSLVKTGNSKPKDFGFRACYP